MFNCGIIRFSPFLLAIALFLPGCLSSYSYKSIDSVYTFQKFNESRLVSEKISPDTMQYLRLNFLDDEYQNNPESVIAKLVESHDKTGGTDGVIPICELSYCHGFRLEADDALKAAAYYALCASFCHDYLAKGIFGQPNNISSKLLLAAGLYNSSVSRGVMLWQKSDTPWSQDFNLDMGYRRFTIAVKADNDHLVSPDFFSSLHSSYDFEVNGFMNSYRSNGLGASIFGVHDRENVPDDFNYPMKLYLPMTAALEFGDTPADKASARKVDLSFYNAMRSDKMSLGGHSFRADADYTVPLTVYLSNNDPAQYCLSGLFNPARHVGKSNIYMLEPYDPDKIPVLLVHGLYSSPSTFLELYNDLAGIPEIRGKCQFWFFFYPSGLPVAESSSILRKRLRTLHDRLDPENKNPNFNDMIVVGHSMGGLLGKTLIQDSDYNVYNAIFKVPFDSPDFTEAERNKIQETLFFSHFSFIKRMVFIATPHQGSQIAIAWWVRLLSKTISLPTNLVNASSRILLNKSAWLHELPPEYQDVMPTSIQALSPNSPVIRVTSKLPIWEKVKFNSIIAIGGSEQGPGSSDGIVPYESAHIDGAESEFLVHDSHTCMSNPRLIAEIKRIIQLHIKELPSTKDSTH